MAKEYEYRQRLIYKDVVIDVKAHSQLELFAKIEKRKKVIDRGDYTKCTVGQWRERYIEVYKRPKISDGWYRDMLLLSSKLKPLDHLPLEKVKPAQLQEILNREQGKTRSTVKKVYDVICGIFRQAYRENMIEKDITKSLGLPATKPDGKRRALTPRERAALLAAAGKHPKGLFILIMLYSGLRPGEVRALQWLDIDIAKGVISVSKAGKQGRQIGPPKTAAGIRKIPLANELRPHLKPGSPFDYVCPNEAGKMMTEQNYKNMWKSFHRLLHIELGGELYRNEIKPPCAVPKDLVPYCLRHTFGTDLEKKQVPINIAKVLMGHEDITTTAKIYTHFDEETFELASSLINAAWK
jgi:integrase